MTGLKVESQAVESSTEGFKAFCDDVSGMFGVNMECEQQEVVAETVAGLKKRFGELVAVNVVDSGGLLDGTFQLVFDQEGLFTLGGLITALPEKEILANRKNASAELAEGMVDAVGEAGHLLVGAWDRVFHEALDAHGHFSQRLPAFVGKPWDKSEEKIGLAGDEELVFVPYEMTVGSLAAFQCGVIFPKTIFRGTSESAGSTAGPTAPTVQDTEEQKGADDKAGSEESGTAQEGGDEESKAKDLEAAVEEQGAVPDTGTAEDIAEEETGPVEKSKESPAGGVSETIRKMAQSPAVLPGESVQPAMEETATLSDTSELSRICARDIMQNRVVWAGPDESVQQALTAIKQHEVGYVMIGQNEVLEGIVSESDIIGTLSPYLRPIFAKWRRPLDDATLKIRVKWIMSKPVRTVKPETSLAGVMENMCRFGGHALAVVDEQGKVRGLVTAFDIFGALLNTNEDTSTVGEPPAGPAQG